MKLKNLIINALITLSVLFGVKTNAQWINIYSTDIIEFTDLNFINDQTGIIIGKGLGDGMILKTTNGNSFTPKFQASGYELNTMYFVNNTSGYAAGKAGYVIKTENYGETWTQLNQNFVFDIYDIYFSNENTGYACGTYGIIKTSNAGDEWQISYQVSGFNYIYCLAENNDGKIFAGAHEGIILYSADQGNSWQSAGSSLVMANINSIVFTNDNKGFACSSNGDILHSTDGGSSWSVLTTLSGTPELFNLYINNEGDLFVNGSNGLIAKSETSGQSWENMSTESNESVVAMAYTNNKIGYAVTNGGTILKDKNDLSIDEKLLNNIQITPNPVKDIMPISVSNSLTFNKIDIYNLNGGKISNIIPANISKGENLYSINCSDLKNGIYLLRLTNKSKSINLKFVKVD